MSLITEVRLRGRRKIEANSESVWSFLCASKVYTTKISEEIEPVAPPSWTDRIGVVATTSGNLDSVDIDTNNLR